MDLYHSLSFICCSQYFKTLKTTLKIGKFHINFQTQDIFCQISEKLRKLDTFIHIKSRLELRRDCPCGAVLSLVHCLVTHTGSEHRHSYTRCFHQISGGWRQRDPLYQPLVLMWALWLDIVNK